MKGKVPKPQEIGLPGKFTVWRPGQEQIVSDAYSFIKGDKGCLLQIVPTGGGKSVCYMAASIVNPGRTLIVTSTKGLQDQLVNEFGGLITVVKGKSAYRCKMNSYSCQFGPCNWGVPCALKQGGCPYYDAVRAAARAPTVVTNYAFWFSNEPETLGRFTLLVCDEAHNSVENLLSCLSVSIRKDDVQLREWPPPGKSFPYYKEWALVLRGKVQDKIDDLKKSRGEGEIVRLVGLKNKLDNVDRARPDNWVADHQGKELVFEPIWPGRLAQPYLFRGIGHVLMTSATANRKTLDLLGVSGGVVKEYPSFFPLPRRPVYYLPTTRVDHRMTEAHMAQWLSTIDQIIRSRSSKKGIVHTTSYALCKRVVNTSYFKEYMVSHDSTNTVNAVESFKRREPPSILVSPSMITGWDFPYDECRWQVIGKVAFPDGRSEVMRARHKIDPDYSCYLAMQALVQACGRGMRAPDDYCESFIIDDHFKWFIDKYKGMAQRWFLDSIKSIRTIPPIGG